MRRFIVGLLATVGALTLLAVGGIAAFVFNGPLASRSLPPSMVLSIDLRSVPSETTSTDVLSGDLWRGSRDLTETLQLLWRAADDPRIVGIYVEIGDESAGLARVQELRQAILRVRGKGKFAIGFAESLGGGGDHFADYYLATALDQIWLQPSGGFAVAGLAVDTPFLKAGMDRLGVHMEGGKRYEYKSAPDTFTETGMTRPARENLQQLLDGLFGQFVEDVARDRKLPAAKVRQLIDQAPFEAYAVTCGLTFTFGGLKTTATGGEVESTDGVPIPGLFAAGELVGGLFYHNYPGGTGLVSGAVLGKLAGDGAGRYVKGKN
ncbi:MAG: S49 family peptidase [Proteobacteria bacterium]|nr:S49 family peptidase [Pseudomonadota bacterium]